MPGSRSTVKASPRRFFALSAICLAAMLASATLWAGDRDGLAEGQAAFNAGNYQLSFAKWSELATTGHSDAQVFIGLSYANGWGVKKDTKLARVWYEKAAKNDNPSGQFLLGVYHISSDDKMEVATGLMWLRRAAANGDDSAKRFLDRARERGWFKDIVSIPEQKQPTTEAPRAEGQQVAAANPETKADSIFPLEPGN